MIGVLVELVEPVAVLLDVIVSSDAAFVLEASEIVSPLTPLTPEASSLEASPLEALSLEAPSLASLIPDEAAAA